MEKVVFTNISQNDFHALMVDAFSASTRQSYRDIKDLKDEVRKLRKEVSTLQRSINAAPKHKARNGTAVSTEKILFQDTICKADVPQDGIKKPRTGTATTSDGIYFKDLNPDR